MLKYRRLGDFMIFKKLIEKYKEDYHISYQDLTDAGESNRLSVLVVSSLLLLSDIIDIILILILYHAHLEEHTHYFIYLAIYTPLNLYIFLHCRHSKESKYLWKTIPVYLLLFVGLSAGVYNFYFLESPHNGFVTFYLAGFLFLIVFSFSPLVYLFELLLTALLMTPGVRENFGFYSVLDTYVVTIIMFFLALYKRRYEKKHIRLLKKQKKSLVAKTFGNFTLMYEGKIVSFSRSRSEELIAYLIYKRGTSVKTKELIAALWGDNADSARYGGSLRNLIVDVRHTFKELDIHNFFISEYNNFRINPEIVKCDYYDFLEGDKTAIRSFVGEFMNQYSWAEEVAGMLEMKSIKI